MRQPYLCPALGGLLGRLVGAILDQVITPRAPESTASRWFGVCALGERVEPSRRRESRPCA
jgi:hypothetical protein